MSIFGRIGKFLGFSGEDAQTSSKNKPKKVDVSTLRAEVVKPLDSSTLYDLHQGAKLVADIKQKWPETFQKIKKALSQGIDNRPGFKNNKKLSDELKDRYDQFQTDAFPVLAALFVNLQKDLEKTELKNMTSSFFASSICEMAMYILWHHEFEETRGKRPPLKIDGIDNPQLAQALAVGAHVSGVMNPLVELLWAISNLQAQEEINKIIKK